MSARPDAGFLRRCVFSTDHKVIAKQYLFTGLAFLAFAGLLAVRIRWQLAFPGEALGLLGSIPADRYPSFFTMHGAIMVFFAVTPIVLGGLGNFVVPLDVGARDMAFPRLNMLSYWFLFAGSVVVAASFLLPSGPAGAGWTLYAPISSSTKVSPGWGEDLLILGLALDAVSIMMGGINYIVTTLNLRAKGLSLSRLPLTVWGFFFTSILNTLWLPIVAAALFMVLCDRRLDTVFFNAGPLAPHQGGQVLLYQHLFWGFGHPEVYILMLPIWGLVGDVLSTFSRKPVFAYKPVVLSMAAITLLSGLVWGHHMFTSGMNPLLGRAFMFLTITISVPTAILFFSWLGTLWRGSLRFRSPMIWAIGFVFMFAIGGLTGLFNAVQTLDVYIHDTYFVVGHFHYTLAAGVVFGVFTFIHFWFPKMFGRMLDERLALAHFLLTFLFANLIFTTMMYVGLGGHMRRISDASLYDFLKPFQHLNVKMGWWALGLWLSQGIFVVNFAWSLAKGRKAGDNPWGCGTLSWATSSPPPEHNFAVPLIVERGPHEYSHPDALRKGRDWLGQWEASRA